MELKRVVITGLGAITPLGNDVETTWKNAIDGVSDGGGVQDVALHAGNGAWTRCLRDGVGAAGEGDHGVTRGDAIRDSEAPHLSSGTEDCDSHCRGPS